MLRDDFSLSIPTFSLWSRNIGNFNACLDSVICLTMLTRAAAQEQVTSGYVGGSMAVRASIDVLHGSEIPVGEVQNT